MSKMKICDFIDKVGDGIHGTPKYDDEGTYFFINGNNLVNGKIEITNETLKISDLEYERIKRPINNNTLLLSINGTLGKIAVYNGEKVALGKSVCFINVKEQVNKYFIKYILSTKEFQKYIQLVSHGSTIKNLAPSQIADYEFNCCNYEYQDKMVFLLKSLDEKIDNNNKINEELESMAKTIYDYWFLQFEFPNEEGKPYKSSGGKMVWNEELKREIPKGWSVKLLKDISEIRAGGDKPKIFSQAITKQCNIPIYSNGLENKGLYGYTEQATIEENSVTVSARGTIGYAVLRNTSFMPIVRLICITPKNKKYSKYIEIFMNKHEFNKNGSIQQQLTIPQISPMKIICPDEKIMDQFNDIMSSIIKKEIIIEKENKELESLRDFLLPLLMNGQVRFRELALAEE